MTLEFDREVIILRGRPVIGTIAVEADLEDGLLYLTATGFEPETPVSGLLWATVEGPAEAWLSQNKGRVEKRALKRVP